MTLTATVSLPVPRKPDIEFGDATTSRVVLGSGEAAVAAAAKRARKRETADA